jgi:hypothetical protein
VDRRRRETGARARVRLPPDPFPQAHRARRYWRRYDTSPSTRCAIANALFAAGTPQ